MCLRMKNKIINKLGNTSENSYKLFSIVLNIKETTYKICYLYTEVPKVMGYLLISCWTSFCLAECSNSTWHGLNKSLEWKSPAGIFSHAVCIEIHKCDKVDGGGVRARTDFSIMSHTCSVGFMTGYLSGQTIRWNGPVCSSNQSMTVMAQ